MSGTTETQKKKILLLVDDMADLLTLKQTLSDKDYEILVATNKSEAAKAIESISLQLIIATEKQAFDFQTDAACIILTAACQDQMEIKRFQGKQLHHFFTRPWNGHQLKQTVKNSLLHQDLLLQNAHLQQLLLQKHQLLLDMHQNMQQELQTGAKLHEVLLLGNLPEKVEGLSIAAESIASKEIDADFYDFYQPSKEILDIVIGDVMGKGMASAVIGSAIKSQLMRFATPAVYVKTFDKFFNWKQDFLPPTDILKEVQKELTEKLIKLEYFVSLFYCRFHLETQSLTFVDCGASKPLHYQAKSNRCEMLQGQNFPLGVIPHDQFEASTIFFSQDDIFVFYSDGVTECKNYQGEMFGTKQIKEILVKNANKQSFEILTLIKEAVLHFSVGNQINDDLTLIVVKINEVMQSTHNKSAFEIEYKSQYSYLKKMREFVAHLCNRARGDKDTLTSQIQLVMNEVFANIVKHSYKENDDGKIKIKASFDDKGIAFEISDQGISFDPTFLKEPSFLGDKEDGFGWHIIKSIMDEIVYVPKQQEKGWNHLRIYKLYFTKEEHHGNFSSN